jgi:hypothetical protein
MEWRKYFSLLFVALSALFLIISLLELIRTLRDEPRLVPYGLEWGFFYRSVVHYRFRLVIDMLLSACAIWGAIGIWRNWKFSWVFILLLAVWVLVPWVTSVVRGDPLW